MTTWQGSDGVGPILWTRYDDSVDERVHIASFCARSPTRVGAKLNGSYCRPSPWSGH